MTGPTLLDTAEDIAWLVSVHIGHHPRAAEVRTAILHGNEDSPVKVECFTRGVDLVRYDDKPDFVMVYDDAARALVAMVTP